MGKKEKRKCVWAWKTRGAEGERLGLGKRGGRLELTAGEGGVWRKWADAAADGNAGHGSGAADGGDSDAACEEEGHRGILHESCVWAYQRRELR